MARELDPAGYRWLRSRIAERWRYIAVLDEDFREICRLDTQTDPRIAVNVNDGAREVVYDVNLRGSDPEISARLPVRIGSTALYATPARHERVPGPNLCTFPVDIDNAWWSKKDVTVVPNSIVAPDGTMTGDAVVEANTTTTYRRVIRNYGIAEGGLVGGREYTFSAYLRPGSRPGASLTVYEGATMRHCMFDLLTGTVTSKHAFFTNAASESAPNGWRRFWVTFTASGVTSGGYAGVYLGTAAGAYSFVGDPIGYPDGIGVWGVQMVPGPKPAPFMVPVVSDYRSRAMQTGVTIADITEGRVLRHRARIPVSLLKEA